MRKRSNKPSQHDIILRHLVLHDHLTTLEGFGLYRIFNLKGRITELRGCSSAPAEFVEFPITIQTEMRDDGTGKTYARYSLSTTEKEYVRHRFPELFLEQQKEAA